jgi:hypothetical protein
MIAAKVYFPGGIVLHTVFFGGSIYCVLADSVEDLPLLDVAFPDVTAKCRGCVGVECVCVLEYRDHRAGVFVHSVQVKAYDSSKYPATGLRPRRLLVWEGRRKGVPGVGWGTGALVTEGAGQGVFCLPLLPSRA